MSILLSDDLILISWQVQQYIGNKPIVVDTYINLGVVKYILTSTFKYCMMLEYTYTPIFFLLINSWCIAFDF